jgi:hypothetical protein
MRRSKYKIDDSKTLLQLLLLLLLLLLLGLGLGLTVVLFRPYACWPVASTSGVSTASSGVCYILCQYQYPEHMPSFYVGYSPPFYNLQLHHLFEIFNNCLI